MNDGFDRWVERFRERAKFAHWSDDDQFYQLKLHLDKTAPDVFRMLPATDLADMETAISAFKPSDIN